MTRPRRAGRRRLARLGAFLACLAAMPTAQGGEEQDTARTFWDAAELSGNLMFFQRHRARYRLQEGRFGNNLHHATLQGSIDFRSPFLRLPSFPEAEIGWDLGLFATRDLYQDASPDHEISFFPWSNPWSADWSKTRAQSGASLYRAHLKLQRAGEASKLWGKLGYFQPSGPGILGVNWALTPGAYLGAEGGGDWGNLSFATAYVTRYKAPWYRETYGFRAGEATEKIDHLWSLGARYRVTPKFSVEAAYGEAPGFLRNAHLKFKYQREETPGKALALSYQFYAVGDRVSTPPDAANAANDLYADHWAFQQYLALRRTAAPYTLRTEFLLTRAPSRKPQHLGYFVYRLSSAYGGANGAYEPWWDNRSDWNHNRERAIFVSVSRTLDDWLPAPGFTIGASAAHGWGGRVYGVRERLKERAWSLDFSYRVPSGPLKGARLALHYTHYDNKTHEPSWTGFKNLFQDERDLKFSIILPWCLADGKLSCEGQ
ncbi:MAG: OprD family porin [Zoogloeaceae bacterium]|jgi:hypothetical protein|nr:OprD family porin [Zoogloeaceae bacterium]